MKTVCLIEVTGGYNEYKDEEYQQVISQSDWQEISDEDYYLLSKYWHRQQSRPIGRDNSASYNFLMNKVSIQDTKIIISDLAEKMREQIQKDEARKAKEEIEAKERKAKKEKRLHEAKEKKIADFMKKYGISYSQAEQMIKELKIK